jgi:DNA polymerase III delta prime subunit
MEIYFLDMSRETLNITSLPLPITQIKLACRLFRFSRLQKKTKKKEERKQLRQKKKKKEKGAAQTT